MTTFAIFEGLVVEEPRIEPVAVFAETTLLTTRLTRLIGLMILFYLCDIVTFLLQGTQTRWKLRATKVQLIKRLNAKEAYL